jgi:anti-anti-sigma regulatory factor
MLKISQIESGDRLVVLRLEGRITGPWVAEMRKACERFLDERRSLKLDLTDIAFADQNGVTALASLKARGVLLADCSPFLAEQLKTSGS